MIYRGGGHGEPVHNTDVVLKIHTVRLKYCYLLLIGSHLRIVVYLWTRLLRLGFLSESFC